MRAIACVHASTGTTIFHAPNGMFVSTIAYVTFHAPQIIIGAHLYANLYFSMHLLQQY